MLTVLQSAQRRSRTALIVSYLLIKWKYALRTKHTWLTALFPPVDHCIVITQPQRVALLAILLLADMMTSAMFLDSESCKCSVLIVCGCASVVRVVCPGYFIESVDVYECVCVRACVRVCTREHTYV